MSQKLIARSPDLLRLQNEGYEVEVRGAHLLVHAVPYVNTRKEIVYGTLVSPLTLNGDITMRPDNHQTWFIGDHPCNKDGTEIAGIKYSSNKMMLGEAIEVAHGFSAKPDGGYADYHAKMTQYIHIISAPAQSIDPAVTAQTYKPVIAEEGTSVFRYADTASARAGIGGIARKLAIAKVAIVGLGGTGSYILDLIAKTHVQEIHLFDGDRFLQHNAFRAPGALSLDELPTASSKVAYFFGVYDKMRRGIVTHEGYITDENVGQLADFDFVFVCVDKPAVRQLISDVLHASAVPFIDVGMDVQLLADEQCLLGQCRTTLSTPAKRDHFARRVSFDNAGVDDLYASNIQIADLNALNATLAVIKWKKYFGFYQDLVGEHDSVYALNAHQLTRDEMS